MAPPSVPQEAACRTSSLSESVSCWSNTQLVPAANCLITYNPIESCWQKNMALFKSQPQFTVDEYLALERSSEERHEYLDGQIYAMAGESLEHGVISVNLVVALGAQLKSTNCQLLTKDTKIRSGPEPRSGTYAGLYSYPDLVVICGQPQFHDEKRDVILNPTVILEVLSPNKESFDRGEKFKRYRQWNQTLKEYLLVWQTLPQIDHYSRQTDGSWYSRLVEGLESSTVISSINCTLSLADVFDRITFAEAVE